MDYAEVNKVDLIAMSTHGRGGVGRWVFGSVAAKVLEGTTKPILLVRAPGAPVSGA
jgi:nucleotide-binding universal stress UspA family protein